MTIFTSKKTKNRGAVLVEFLLVLPIYFVLMGGVFWVGDLFIARHKLLQSDRAAAWGYAVRQNSSDPVLALNLALFDAASGNILTTSGQVRGIRGTGDNPKGSWTQSVGATAKMFISKPPWTTGWQGMSFQLGAPAEPNVPLNLSSDMERAGRQKYLHAAIMRTKSGETGVRSWWPPARLCHESSAVPGTSAVWHDVWKEKYPYHSADDLGRMSSGQDSFSPPTNNHKDYERFKYFGKCSEMNWFPIPFL